MQRTRGHFRFLKKGWVLMSCAPRVEPSLFTGSLASSPWINCLASKLTCSHAWLLYKQCSCWWNSLLAQCTLQFLRRSCMTSLARQRTPGAGRSSISVDSSSCNRQVFGFKPGRFFYWFTILCEEPA